MREHLVVSLLLISLLVGCHHTEGNGVRHSAGSYYMGDAPRPLNSLADLPVPLSRQVEAHLLARLGAVFYQELHFTGGRAADPADARWKDKAGEEACAYELFFELNRPAAGLTSYMALLSLKRDGSILHEIDLPAVARFPDKLKIISLGQARAIARRRGFDGADSVEIKYDPVRDVLGWCFSKQGEMGHQGLHIRVLEILAHDARMVREYDSFAIP